MVYFQAINVKLNNRMPPHIGSKSHPTIITRSILSNTIPCIQANPSIANSVLPLPVSPNILQPRLKPLLGSASSAVLGDATSLTSSIKCPLLPVDTALAHPNLLHPSPLCSFVFSPAMRFSSSHRIEHLTPYLAYAREMSITDKSVSQQRTVVATVRSTTINS